MSLGIAIVGVGETVPVRRSDKNVASMICDAILAALDDAGLTPRDVDGLISDGANMPLMATHDQIAGELGIERRFSAGISAGGAGLAASPLAAAHAISSGQAEVVVCYFGLDAGSRPGGPAAFHSHYPAKALLEWPYGFIGQAAYFAMWARRYLHEFPDGEQAMEELAIMHSEHAALNGKGQARKVPLTHEQYRASRLVTDPLRVADCCLITDGAGAFVMTSKERARDCRKKPVEVLGASLRAPAVSAASALTQYGDLITMPGTREASADALGMAGVGINDISFAQIYDCFTISAIVQLENLGLCQRGEAATALRSGRFRLGGAIPVNTHGGLLSYSYRLGIEHIVEAVRQLRGEAGAAQVKDAQVGIVTGLSPPDYGVMVLGA